MSAFDKFLDEYGPPGDATAVSAAQLSRYSGRLPDAVLDLWRSGGFCSYAKGAIWVTDPGPLERPLRELLAQQASAPIPLVRTAIGNVVFWDRDEFHFCDVHYYRVLPCGDAPEILFNHFLIGAKARRSILHLPIFHQARRRLGPLAADEMYGYKLPLVMGGKREVANMDKMKVREHWSLLARAHGTS